MILRRDIQNLLEDLNDYYNTEAHPRSTHYAKLAVMELCGWIEQSLDQVANRCIKNKIRSHIYQNIMSDIIDKNYGFNYKRNFRKMMLQTIGILQMERLEEELNITGEMAILNSILDSLTTERNRAAHTTNAGVMLTYQAPSITINQLDQIYPIIRKLYSFAVNN